MYCNCLKNSLRDYFFPPTASSFFPVAQVFLLSHSSDMNTSLQLLSIQEITKRKKKTLLWHAANIKN